MTYHLRETSFGVGLKVRTTNSLSFLLLYYFSNYRSARWRPRQKGKVTRMREWGQNRAGLMAPDRLGALIDLALRPKNQESGEAPGKPTIMGHCDNSALITRKRPL